MRQLVLKGRDVSYSKLYGVREVENVWKLMASFQVAG